MKKIWKKLRQCFSPKVSLDLNNFMEFACRGQNNWILKVERNHIFYPFISERILKIIFSLQPYRVNSFPPKRNEYDMEG